MKERGVMANYAKDSDDIAVVGRKELGQADGWLCPWKSSSVHAGLLVMWSEKALEVCVLDLER